MKIRWLIQHYCKVLQHKYYLAISGRKVGVSLWRILIHDWTKFALSEAIGYAKYFNGGEKYKSDFDDAWLHHQNHNPHHWEYWVHRSAGGPPWNSLDFTPKKMPEKFVREMIADWMAASKSYAHTWDMSKWIATNWTRLIFHPETRKLARKVLEEQGYFINTSTDPTTCQKKS